MLPHAFVFTFLLKIRAVLPLGFQECEKSKICIRKI